MFQIEIFEYTPKISDIYNHFFYNIENRNSSNQNKDSLNYELSLNNNAHHIEDTIENKFLKIKTLHHPLISRYFNYIRDDNNYIFISDFEGDGLDELMDVKLSEKAYFKQTEVIKILFQIVLAINQFERKGVNLRFLEPKRILINDEGLVKIRSYITDILFRPEELKFINNLKYLSPELIFYPFNEQCSKSVIWSLGMIALELLIDIQTLSQHQNLFYIFSSKDFIKDYVEIITKYKESSIFIKSENKSEISFDSKLLLEFYLNGHFIKKTELDDNFKDFLTNCLNIDPDKRKDSSYLLYHPLFNNIKKSVLSKIDNTDYYMIPISKEQIHNLVRKFNGFSKFTTSANGYDNYEIFKNILKINIPSFIKKKGLISYKPKILSIPNYFSLYIPSTHEGNLEDIEDEGKISINTLISKNKETRKSIESIYENEFLKKDFNEGCVSFIGSHIINLPTDYEKDSTLLDNLMRTSIGEFKSDGHSTISDKSSDKMNSSNLNLNLSNLGKSSSNPNVTKVSSSNQILQNQNQNNILKEINYYMKIKSLIYNIIFHQKNLKKEDLIAEIKRGNCHIPNNLRPLVYLIILEVDYFNDREELETANFYENKNFIQKEMSQIKKDIARCEEYDFYFKTDEGKCGLHSIFQGLLYNKEDFFYSQGMDSIASALIKLFHPEIEFSYQIFYKIFKKLLCNFYDLDHKTLKNLGFHHLILQRLISFIDPEIYLHLNKIAFFEDQFATCWTLTLFSRTFHFNVLYKIWDVLIIENVNIIYLFICFIFIENRSYILNSDKETILKDLGEISDCVEIESYINGVINFYKFIPQSLIPISFEFNEEILKELKQNEFFKNRWWDFENFYTEIYTVPIINLEDAIKFFDKITFLDIRLQQEYEMLRIKDSIHLGLNKNKYFDSTILNLEKNNGLKIVVIVGNKNSKYGDYTNFLLNKNIKFVVILQGGIDVVYVDEFSLIFKK